MTGQAEISIARAREHVETGERILEEVEVWRRDMAPLGVPSADRFREASAHFAAAMAITNILLTDPGEAPEVIER